MKAFFQQLFSTDGFPPRWHCGTWEPGHGWLHIISDSLIFGAYTAIPVTLIFFAWRKQREILFKKIVWLFAAFILVCGVGHLIEATIFWHPWYRFAGVVKATTAVVSWVTVMAIIVKMPTALRLPGMATMIDQLRDTVSEQKKISAELGRSNEDLDQFAYVASHDLKAPLRSIKNLAGWVAEDCDAILPDESKRHLDQLQQRVGRLGTLLDDLLTYSRAGQDLSQPELVDVEGMVKRIFVEYTGMRSDLLLRVVGECPPIRTWRMPLEQVLRNLIDNAIKHRGGSDGLVEFSAEAGEESITYRVRDNGCGIAEEFHERVFRMFQTLKPKDEVEGSGMGLALVAKLVERMGGEITLDSKVGAGATFSICLPKTPPR